MGRWEPGSRGRLQEAALALFTERGYDQTTAAQIAERAGLSERTFFRHFADKREVLFGGSDLLRDRMTEAVAAAPSGEGALGAVAHGLDAAAEMLGDGRRDLTRQRRAVIAATPELRERELAKLAEYASAITAELHGRGAAEPEATLAAEAGMAVMRIAMETWSSAAEGGPDLPAVMRGGVAALRRMAAVG